MKVEVVSAEGKPLVTWDWRSLSALPASAIVNAFPYDKFKSGPYGLEAGMGASAIVTLLAGRCTRPSSSFQSVQSTSRNGSPSLRTA